MKIGLFFERLGYRITFVYDVFQSIAPVEEGYLGFFRRFNLSAGKICYIYLQRYDENFKTIGKPERIDRGEDPRIIIFRGEVYAFFYKYFSETRETKSYIYQPGTGKFLPLTIENNYFQGKNWIPFEYRSELYFILDLETFKIEFIYSENINSKGLHDPCSFYAADGDIFVAMTVSEDDWMFQQNFKNTIHVIKNGVNIINQYIEYYK